MHTRAWPLGGARGGAPAPHPALCWPRPALCCLQMRYIFAYTTPQGLRSGTNDASSHADLLLPCSAHDVAFMRIYSDVYSHVRHLEDCVAAPTMHRHAELLLPSFMLPSCESSAVPIVYSSKTRQQLTAQTVKEALPWACARRVVSWHTHAGLSNGGGAG